MRDSRSCITTVLFTAVLAMFAWDLNVAADLVHKHDPKHRPHVAAAWGCILAGRWDVGPFERPIPSVRLSDESTNHMSCGASCKAKGVGR